MLVLFETAAGYAVFKLLDEKKLQEADNIYKDFETPEKASKVVKLKHFSKFKDTTEALAAATASVEGKMSKPLKKMLKKLVVDKEQLLVADAKLGQCIKEKLDVGCLTNSNVHELMRCIRTQRSSLIEGLPDKEMAAMSLGLAHSLSRYKLKFSPDKVDTMIVQSISLLDDLDKELNNYNMRCREWYGWHFPELGKIISDHVAYAKSVSLMGHRQNCTSCDFSDILPEEVEEEMKAAAEISMGTEVADHDIENIRHLCKQVLEISEYRAQLYDYLKNRMMAIAPNLTVLVGELVGARLISHAGSLLNLAKHPSSTVQILGAEKALFRALKSRKDTPKYGLIYHASLVSQSSTKNKGKVSRMLAAKCSLAIRVDALGEETGAEMGIQHRATLENRVKAVEDGFSRRLSGKGKSQGKWEKYENKSEVKVYNTNMDSTLPKKRKFDEVEQSPVKVKDEPGDESPVKSEKKKKKKKADNEESVEQVKTPKSEKKKKKRLSEGGGDEAEVPAPETPKSEKKEKKKKKRASELGGGDAEEMEVSTTETPVSEKKKKKKKKADDANVTLETTMDSTLESGTPKSGKKKKKKKPKEEDSD